MTTKEPGDDLWEEFVREFEKNNAPHEPSAAERAQQSQQKPARRRPGRWLVLPAAAVLLAAVGGLAYLTRPAERGSAVAADPVPSVKAPVTASAPVSTGSPAAASAGVVAGAPTAAIPLSVFPEKVQGYTLVAKVANPSCTEPDIVASTLADLIAHGHGCLGVDLALYKDADGNQYNLVLFTMKDQTDAVFLMSMLASHIDIYQVAVQVPPKDSGLRPLPADSGLVQNFGFAGHGLLVGMAQWSDGRTADFNTLVGQLSPLTDAVMRDIPA